MRVFQYVQQCLEGKRSLNPHSQQGGSKDHQRLFEEAVAVNMHKRSYAPEAGQRVELLPSLKGSYAENRTPLGGGLVALGPPPNAMAARGS